MFKNLFARIAFATIVLTSASAAFAAADPSLQEVYQAANTGHLEQAQAMMSQVLQDHPGSAKAHYVAAEIYARGRHESEARQELSTAQSIDPRLSFVSPASVSALRAQLAQGAVPGRQFERTSRSAFPFGWIALLVGAVVLLWFMFRRRAQAPVVVQAPGGIGAGPSAYPNGAYPNGGYGAGPMGGSGLGGSLATGLAMGAGVVAGEELVRHFVGGEHQSTLGAPGLEEHSAPPVNGDMGGSDFGISDGGSWGDDGGGGFSSGGDDWS